MGPGSVVLGQLAGAHGLRGQVRIRYFGDRPDNLLAQDVVWLGRERDDAAARRFEVSAAGSGRAGEVRLTLAGVGDRDAAQELRGLLVLGNPDELPSLPEGDYYWHELMDCRVESSDGRLLGQVGEIWQTGAHDVLVVVDERGGQHLVPTAREVMTEVDLEHQRIVIELLPGLWDEGE